MTTLKLKRKKKPFSLLVLKIQTLNKLYKLFVPYSN